MMDLFDLDNYIHNLSIDGTDDEKDTLLECFEKDFKIDDVFVDGSKVKIIWALSKEEGFENYPETFVHLITRKSKSGKRVFDKHRANKIHWIKCILENKDEPEIIFFQYPESNGDIRDYYWFKEGDFLVIIKQILPDCMIVTSFHVDDKRNRDYFEKKYKWYVNNKA